MSDKVTRFLGDTPGRTIIKLTVISLVVGIVMSALGLTPWEVWDSVRNFVVNLYNLGFEALGRVGTYLVWGAIIVVPVFVILRLLQAGR